MAIPEYNEMYNAFLETLEDGHKHSLEEVRSRIMEAFNLTDREVLVTMPNSTEKVFTSRVGWCRTYLKNAGLLTYEDRAVYKITEEGLALINSGEKITTDTLLKYDDFRRYISGNKRENSVSVKNETPEETMLKLHEQQRRQLKDELLQIIINSSWEFFEKLVVDLLEKMGYCDNGGYGEVTPSQNDGGIDGIIYRDRLKLDVIYIQAKRWNPDNKKPEHRCIDRPLIDGFIGAMDRKKSKKGVFIATCPFTEGAKEACKDRSIALVDGDMLTDLMIEYNLGVETKSITEIKGIDQGYFLN